MKKFNVTNFTLLTLSIFLILAESGAKENPLIVYSSRKQHLIEPVFKLFTEKTGIKIEYRTDKAGPLLQRIKAEGKRTKADILMTVDAGNLWQASQMDLLQPIKSKILNDNIPPHLRDTQGLWFGFSLRARTIVYNPKKVKRDQLSTYESLADKQWKGKLLLRTSKKVYNQSLVATLINRLGKDSAQLIIRGWVDNLAAPVYSSDTKLLEAILAGVGDVGIVNSYYLGRMLKKKKDLSLNIFWANQNTSGVHVNISGAGITKNAKNKHNAIKFLEWLSTEDAQGVFADANMEYPVNSKVKPSTLVSDWGGFVPDTTHLSYAGTLQKKAIQLMDESGYR